MTAVGVNLELFFVTEVLQLNSLHYGYWAEPSTAAQHILDLRDIQQAQEQYTRELLQVIPADVQSVLDVGCGIGDNARAMLSRGLKVTALSPDENHKRYFEDIRTQNLTFHSSRFEDFETDEIFDLVLMSESQNYFDAEIGLKQARRYLRAGGYLLIAGMFR
ncbi:MAG: methyltransferase domain-containing protein, partial [Verrucomicrobiota bacterium]|nr:methyltransferase domain-containing protein [Verrucomicrobiota bacterium]